MNINDINVAALQALVHKEGDEFDALMSLDGSNGTSNSALNDALTEVLQAEKKAKIAKAAGEVLKVLQVAEAKMQTMVTEVRCMRMKEKAHLAQLKRIETARAYARDTMNLMPLVSAIKGDNEHLIPATWKKKTK